jgi:hypothetical protein
MTAKRGQQVQDPRDGEAVQYHVLCRADREAGAKMRGVAAERASRESAY